MKIDLSSYLSYDEVVKAFRSNIATCAIGARTCYLSNPNLTKLLLDKRIDDKNEMTEYLIRLYKAGHTSVFAHAFKWFKLNKKEDAMYIASMLFKSIWGGSTYEWNIDEENKDKYIGLSLRHILEHSSFDKEKLISDIVENKSTDLFVITSNIKDWNIEVSLLYSYDYFGGWYVYYVEGLSKVATHQIVRHTMLNFSQKSDRYTKIESINDTLYPVNTDNEEVLFKSKCSRHITVNTYHDLIENHKVKREDARYILPQGTRTAIVVSGDNKAFHHFYKLRLDKKAQLEVRLIAETMKYLV